MRENPKINGIKTGTVQYKIGLYADYIIFLTDTVQSSKVLEDHITQYENVSAYKVNLAPSPNSPIVEKFLAIGLIDKYGKMGIFKT